MTNRQLRFCEEYPVDLNATKAAERSGYSKRTAYSIGQRLLKNVEVAACIAERLKARSERVGLTADEVLSELKVLALSDLTHYRVDENGNVTTDNPEALRALSSIKRKPSAFGHEVEIKAWDKPAALRMAGQHLGLWGPKGTEDDPLHEVHRVVTEEDRQKRLDELRRHA